MGKDHLRQPQIVVFVDRWSRVIDSNVGKDHPRQLLSPRQWSLLTGGLWFIFYIGLLFKWSLKTGGLFSQMVFIIGLTVVFCFMMN